MRICFISPYLLRFHRGIERSGIQLANQLARMGQAITILTWNEPNGTTASPLEPHIRLVRVPYVRYLRRQWAVPFYAYHLIAGRYDVVVVFFAGHGEAEALCLARKLRSFRTVFIVGYPIDLVPGRFEEFRRWGLDRSLGGIVVKSLSMAEAVADFFGRPVDVIPNGVDTGAFDPSRTDAALLRQRLGIGESDKTLLTVAALEERKGIQHVIAAMPALLRDGFPTHYVVAGDGPYRSELESLAARLGVSEKVHLVGVESDILPYYKLADVFLLLSYGEGFPNALLEAWAMGLPVIVSEHPPYPSILVGGTGYMVDETDTGQVAKVLRELLGSEELRHEIGRRVRRHAEEIYGWPAVAARYMEVFACGKGV